MWERRKLMLMLMLVLIAQVGTRLYGWFARICQPWERSQSRSWLPIVEAPGYLSQPPNLDLAMRLLTVVLYSFNSFNPNVLVTIALGLSAMCIIAIPLSRIFVILLVLAGIFGGCFGATDTFTTVQLIRMYGKQVSG